MVVMPYRFDSGPGYCSSVSVSLSNKSEDLLPNKHLHFFLFVYSRNARLECWHRVFNLNFKTNEDDFNSFFRLLKSLILRIYWKFTDFST